MIFASRILSNRSMYVVDWNHVVLSLPRNPGDKPRLVATSSFRGIVLTLWLAQSVVLLDMKLVARENKSAFIFEIDLQAAQSCRVAAEND